MQTVCRTFGLARAVAGEGQQLLPPDVLLIELLPEIEAHATGDPAAVNLLCDLAAGR